ncbi:MAG: heavy metal-binding protein [Rhodobacterales bacterium]|nr:MAG: heavy metal-binding protein [Rhodobacterales bacterium]
MSCGHCKAAIEQAVTEVDGAAGPEFDMQARTVRIRSGLELPVLLDVLKAEGYEAAPV